LQSFLCKLRDLTPAVCIDPEIIRMLQM